MNINVKKVIYYAKIWTLLKICTWNVALQCTPVQIAKYATAPVRQHIAFRNLSYSVFPCLLESPGFLSLKFQDLESHFGPGKSWKLKFKVLVSPGKYPWKYYALRHFCCEFWRLKLHQISNFPGLCPGPRWGSLQLVERGLLPFPKNPTPLSCLWASFFFIFKHPWAVRNFPRPFQTHGPWVWKGPGKFLMGSWKIPGFFVSKRVGTLDCWIRHCSGRVMCSECNRCRAALRLATSLSWFNDIDLGPYVSYMRDMLKGLLFCRPAFACFVDLLTRTFVPETNLFFYCISEFTLLYVCTCDLFRTVGWTDGWTGNCVNNKAENKTLQTLAWFKRLTFVETK